MEGVTCVVKQGGRGGCVRAHQIREACVCECVCINEVWGENSHVRFNNAITPALPRPCPIPLSPCLPVPLPLSLPLPLPPSLTHLAVAAHQFEVRLCRLEGQQLLQAGGAVPRAQRAWCYEIERRGGEGGGGEGGGHRRGLSKLGKQAKMYTVGGRQGNVCVCGGGSVASSKLER